MEVEVKVETAVKVEMELEVEIEVEMEAGMEVKIKSEKDRIEVKVEVELREAAVCAKSSSSKQGVTRSEGIHQLPSDYVNNHKLCHISFLSHSLTGKKDKKKSLRSQECLWCRESWLLGCIYSMFYYYTFWYV